MRVLFFPAFDPLVIEGADLFLNETFDGNGRTCGSCHPPENNFTIDPEFIATLPDKDPLFVAEFVKELKKNFEKPALMRGVGLILENTNGFGDLKNDFTMRGVPHTLALSTSLKPADFGGGPVDGTTVPPNDRTGWSGDGAPGSGTLRDFATGAVTQHFTKTLKRKPGKDFRLPDDDELDAMEAFQLFLGRDADPDIASIMFTNPVVAFGRDTFDSTSTGKCSLCHSDAGATVGGLNFNFDTGVEDLPAQPADLIDPANNPADDGFGNPGNGTFNTPPLVEAADTGPFFHNNAIETIEGAVAFYNSDAFNGSSGAAGLAAFSPTGAGIDLETTEVIAVAAFLRVLNALENIRSAEESVVFSQGVRKSNTVKSLLRLAIAEVEDAIEVLDGGGLHPKAQQGLSQALDQLEAASLADDKGDRKKFIKGALKKLDQAGKNMVKG